MHPQYAFYIVFHEIQKVQITNLDCNIYHNISQLSDMALITFLNLHRINIEASYICCIQGKMQNMKRLQLQRMLGCLR